MSKTTVNLGSSSGSEGDAAGPVKVVGRTSRIVQFRLYKDANKAIPLHLGTKTDFVKRSVALAAEEPWRLGLALAHRASRSVTDVTERVSITWEDTLAENVMALSQVMRMSNEEIVRLAVEANAFCMSQAVLMASRMDEDAGDATGLQVMVMMAQVMA